MDDAAIVRRSDTGTELARDFLGFRPGQPADALQERRKILAVDVFHRQEHLAIGLPDVVHTADIGVRHLPGVAHLAAETLEHVGPARERGTQELERHGLRQLDVIGAIHIAHAAASEQSDDAVAPRKNLARLERRTREAGRRLQPADGARERSAAGARGPGRGVR